MSRPIRAIGRLCMALCVALPFAGVIGAGQAAAQDEPDLIFKKSTVWKLLTPDHKLATYAIDDPLVKGVACHFTVPEKGGVSGWLGVAEEVSDISLACRQVGPVSFTEKFEQGDEMFPAAPVVPVQEDADRSRLRREAQRSGLSRLFGQGDRGESEELDLDGADHAVGRRGGAALLRLARGLGRARSDALASVGGGDRFANAFRLERFGRTEVLLQQRQDVLGKFADEAVVDRRAVAPRAHQPLGSQEGELLGDGGHAHPCQFRQLSDTDLATGHVAEKHEPWPGRQHLEKAGRFLGFFLKRVDHYLSRIPATFRAPGPFPCPDVPRWHCPASYRMPFCCEQGPPPPIWQANLWSQPESDPCRSRLAGTWSSC